MKKSLHLSTPAWLNPAPLWLRAIGVLVVILISGTQLINNLPGSILSQNSNVVSDTVLIPLDISTVLVGMFSNSESSLNESSVVISGNNGTLDTIPITAYRWLPTRSLWYVKARAMFNASADPRAAAMVLEWANELCASYPSATLVTFEGRSIPYQTIISMGGDAERAPIPWITLSQIKCVR